MEPLQMVALALLGVGVTFVVSAVRVRRHDPVQALVAEFEGDVASTLDPYHAQLARPLPVRLLGRMVAASQAAVTRLLPSNAMDETRRVLAAAGLTGSVTAEEFVAFRLLAALGGGAFGLAIGIAVGGVQGVAAGALALLIGVLAPRAFVERTRQARVAQIESELPDSLDLLAISVEAGLGFEQAIAAVIDDRGDSPLSAELGHTLREMQLGRTRVEALRELQRRVSVPDLDSLVLSLIQADALGMPLTRILRTQAAELRRRRRQRVREAAAKLPVKMLFPLVLFILPALFVVVLGPAAISISRTF